MNTVTIFNRIPFSILFKGNSTFKFTRMSQNQSDGSWLYPYLILAMGTISLLSLIWYWKARSAPKDENHIVCFLCEKCGHKNKLIPDTSRVPQMLEKKGHVATPIVMHRSKMVQKSVQGATSSYAIQKKLKGLTGVGTAKVRPLTSIKPDSDALAKLKIGKTCGTKFYLKPRPGTSAAMKCMQTLPKVCE